MELLAPLISHRAPLLGRGSMPKIYCNKDNNNHVEQRAGVFTLCSVVPIHPGNRWSDWLDAADEGDIGRAVSCIDFFFPGWEVYTHTLT